MGVCGVFIFLCCCHCQRLCTANPNELAWISMRLVRLSFEWFGVCACATHILCIDLLAQHSVKVSRSTVCEWCDLSHLTHFSVQYCPFVTLSRTVRSLARSRSLFLSLKHKHCDLLSKHFNGVLVLVFTFCSSILNPRCHSNNYFDGSIFCETPPPRLVGTCINAI